MSAYALYTEEEFVSCDRCQEEYGYGIEAETGGIDPFDEDNFPEERTCVRCGKTCELCFTCRQTEAICGECEDEDE